MNKNKLLTIIASISLVIIFISLIAMMILTPSGKEKNNDLYKKDSQSVEN